MNLVLAHSTAVDSSDNYENISVWELVTEMHCEWVLTCALETVSL